MPSQSSYSQNILDHKARQQKENAEYQTNLKVALNYYHKSDLDKAIPLLEDLFDDRPSQYLYNYLFRSYIQREEYTEAEKLVRIMLRKQKTYYRYRVDYAFTKLMQGEEKKANKALAEIIESMPPVKHQVLSVANALIARQLYDWAQDAYEKGQQLVPGYSFYGELANLSLYRGDFEGMISMYILQLSEDPEAIDRIKSRIQYYLTRDLQGSLSEMFRLQLLEASQKHPENRSYNELLLWVSLQQKDFDMAILQAKALDQRFEETGLQVYELAQVCIDNQCWNAAEEGLKYLIKQYKDVPALAHMAESALLKVQYMQLGIPTTTNIDQLKKLSYQANRFLTEGELGRVDLPLIETFSKVEAFDLNQPKVALEVIYKAIKIRGLSSSDLARLKLLKADIWVFTERVWDAKLLYMQVEKDLKHEPIGHLAKYKNAELSYYLGEFGWAIGLLDILKSATTKFIANDALELSLRIKDNLKEDSTAASLKVFAHAELLSKQHQRKQATYFLDSLYSFTDNYPLKGDILYLKANIKMDEADFQAADSLLQVLVRDFPDEILADDALMQLGLINEQYLLNFDKAMHYYEQIIIKYPTSILVQQARERYRKLRGK